MCSAGRMDHCHLEPCLGPAKATPSRHSDSGFEDFRGHGAGRHRWRRLVLAGRNGGRKQWSIRSNKVRPLPCVCVRANIWLSIDQFSILKHVGVPTCTQKVTQESSECSKKDIISKAFPLLGTCLQRQLFGLEGLLGADHRSVTSDAHPHAAWCSRGCVGRGTPGRGGAMGSVAGLVGLKMGLAMIANEQTNERMNDCIDDYPWNMIEAQTLQGL